MKSSDFQLTEKEQKIFELAKFFGQKMLESYEDCRSWIPTSNDPRLGKNWQIFSDIYDLTELFDYDYHDYINGVFNNYEKMGDFKIEHPKQLLSAWSVKKFANYVNNFLRHIERVDNQKAQVEGVINGIAFMYRYVNRNNGIGLSDFFSKNSTDVLPQAVIFITSGFVALNIVSVLRPFWTMLSCLAKDEIEEYFGSIEEIENIRDLTLMNKSLMDVIKNYIEEKELVIGG